MQHLEDKKNLMNQFEVNIDDKVELNPDVLNVEDWEMVQK